MRSAEAGDGFAICGRRAVGAVRKIANGNDDDSKWTRSCFGIQRVGVGRGVSGVVDASGVAPARIELQQLHGKSRALGELSRSKREIDGAVESRRARRIGDAHLDISDRSAQREPSGDVARLPAGLRFDEHTENALPIRNDRSLPCVHRRGIFDQRNRYGLIDGDIGDAQRPYGQWRRRHGIAVRGRNACIRRRTCVGQRRWIKVRIGPGPHAGIAVDARRCGSGNSGRLQIPAFSNHPIAAEKQQSAERQRRTASETHLPKLVPARRNGCIFLCAHVKTRRLVALQTEM